MSRHRAANGRRRTALLALVALLAAGGTITLIRTTGASDPGSELQARAVARSTPDALRSGCAELTVVSTAGFVPVLTAAQARVGSGDGCASLRVIPADGHAAGTTASSSGADAWIADDAAWAGSAPKGLLADDATRVVLATSPVYLVAGPAEAAALQKAGGTWEAVADRTAHPGGLRLVVADPRSSATGLVAAGGLGEAVWLTSGMDASAAALARSFENTRTVAAGASLLPVRPGEVALVPEQTLLREQKALRPDDVVLAPRDHTALLRFSLLPTARGTSDPVKAAALRRLQEELTGSGGQLDPEVAAALEAAGLRRPGGPAPRTGTDAPALALPEPTAKPFAVLKPHHVDHVFAVWYPEARRANALLVVDVSGSMGNRLPCGGTRIGAARQGSSRVASVLPDDSVLGLWRFGTRLDGARDYQAVVPSAPLTAAHRAAVDRALADLHPQRTGTGLYDTILAAYQAVARTSRPGVPDHVLVFTDGKNEFDRNSLSVEQLGAELAAASVGRRPISIVVLTFGRTADAKALNAALEPVGGGVVTVRTEREVEAAFLHFAAGGLHLEE